MRRTDGRKLSHEALEGIRIQAVKSVVQLQNSPELVIQGLGFGRTVIYDWLKKYQEGGWQALKSSKAKGPEPKITKQEEKKLKRWLTKNPRQLAIDFGLWTLTSIQELLQKKFSKQLHISNVSRLLKRIGYTHQKPLYRAYEQNPQAVTKWQQVEYPKICKEAKKEGREIFFSDESGFRSTGAKEKTWAKKGQRPIVRTIGKRYGVNAISAISPKGHFRFSLYEGSFTGRTFIDFLKKLLQSSNQSITLIVDGHPAHKQKAVKKFTDNTNGRLKIYFLPPYSPELNPDEQVWQHTKPVIHKEFPKSKARFKSKIRSHLHKLQKLPELIKSFFSHPDVSYITQR